MSHLLWKNPLNLMLRSSLLFVFLLPPAKFLQFLLNLRHNSLAGKTDNAVVFAALSGRQHTAGEAAWPGASARTCPIRSRIIRRRGGWGLLWNSRACSWRRRTVLFAGGSTTSKRRTKAAAKRESLKSASGAGKEKHMVRMGRSDLVWWRRGPSQEYSDETEARSQVRFQSNSAMNVTYSMCVP